MRLSAPRENLLFLGGLVDKRQRIKEIFTVAEYERDYASEQFRSYGGFTLPSPVPGRGDASHGPAGVPYA